MIKIHVAASRQYDVILNKGILSMTGMYVKDALGLQDDPITGKLKNKKICIVTDETVDPLYGRENQTLWRSLTLTGFEVHKYVFPGGEDSKNMETIEELLEFLAAKRFTRTDVLLALGGGVRVSGLRPDSLQGDRLCRVMLRRLEHPGAVLDLSACPDLGPVLFAAAAQRCGAVFTGTRRLRIKESDRAAAMAQELAKFGAQVTVEEDRVTVLPRPLHAPNEELDGHNDHRIVMAMAVLCASLGGTIRGAEAVNKSYPDFFRTLRALGLRMDVRP